MKKEGKKKLIIIAIVIIALVLAAGAYFLFFGKSAFSFGFGADFSKGSMDFGKMGDSNTFKDVKLNPFEDENG